MFNTATATRIKQKKFWEGLNAYFLLTRHGPHRKLCFRCSGSMFPQPLSGNNERIWERPTDMTQTAQKTTHLTVLLLLRALYISIKCILVARLAYAFTLKTEAVHFTNKRYCPVDASPGDFSVISRSALSLLITHSVFFRFPIQSLQLHSATSWFTLFHSWSQTLL
jgi:hypothetical protein